MIRIVLVGAAGRMGRAVEAAVQAADDVEIVARVGRKPAGLEDLRQNFPAGTGVWTDDAQSVTGRGDVIVDFSGPAGARAAAAAAALRGAALVTGSTGLTAADETALRDAAGRVAVLRATNFSLGVAALRVALRAALASVPASWDVEIVERHHRLKQDSPSGTALTLAEDVRAIRDGAGLRQGREGVVGPRQAGEIGMHSVRGGTWVGDHQVLLAGEGETLELRHVAQDRAAFAQGALAAARFVAGATPGWYTLDDMLRGSLARAH